LPRHVDARTGLLIRLGRKAKSLASASGVQFDFTGDLGHSIRRLAEKFLFLIDATCDLGSRAGNALATSLQTVEGGLESSRRSGDRTGRLLYVRDELAQLAQHAAEALREIIDLVGEAGVRSGSEVDAQIALADTIGRGPNGVEFRTEHAGEGKPDSTAHAERDEKRAPGRESDSESTGEVGHERGRRRNDERTDDESGS